MSEKKPTPALSGPIPALCPVCGQPSYSVAGVHPQCAVVQADAPRRESLAAERAAEKQVKRERPATAFRKTCPRCRAEVPVRKRVCTCGFRFAVS